MISLFPIPNYTEFFLNSLNNHFSFQQNIADSIAIAWLGVTQTKILLKFSKNIPTEMLMFEKETNVIYFLRAVILLR